MTGRQERREEGCGGLPELGVQRVSGVPEPVLVTDKHSVTIT